MAHLRLRTQLLIATLLIICALLGALLFCVRRTVRSEIAEGVRQSTNASLNAFENVQQEHEMDLSQTAELPTLKAVMATQHALTIQDASEPLWKLAGSQLFVLSSPDGRVLGFHVSKPGWEPSLAAADLKKSIERGENVAWWYDNGQLYRVFLRSVFAGSGINQRQLGIIALGYQIDSAVAGQLGLTSGSQIALAADDRIIASTLSASKKKELLQVSNQHLEHSSGSRG